MRVVRWLPAAMAGFMMAPAPLQAAAPAAAEAPVRADALALAEAMVPKDLFVKSELRQFDLNFKSTILAGKTEKQADRNYPGLTNAVVAAVRPLVAKSSARSLPILHEKIARLAQERLSSAETAELTAFYRSPTGRKALRFMAQSTDGGAAYKSAAENPAARSAYKRQAAEKAARELSPADQMVLTEFMKRPVFAKLARMQPQVRQMQAEFHNRQDPVFKARMAETVAAAMAEHVKEIDRWRQRR